MRLNVSFLLILVFLVSNQQFARTAGAADAPSVAEFKCLGASTVPAHGDSFYHFYYDGKLKGKLTEDKKQITSTLAKSMNCGLIFSIPPPRPATSTEPYLREVIGLSCNSWAENAPATGYQIHLKFQKNQNTTTETSALGSLSFFIDDNSPNLSILPNPANMTQFACDHVIISQ